MLVDCFNNTGKLELSVIVGVKVSNLVNLKSLKQSFSPLFIKRKIKVQKIETKKYRSIYNY